MEKWRDKFFIIEIILFTLFFHGVNMLGAPQAPGFVGIHPNPHWITVLLIASRYGMIQGLLAGSGVALFYVTVAQTSGQIDFTSMTFPHQEYAQPFFFILIGAILGEVRSFYKKQKNDLEERSQATSQTLHDLSQFHKAVVESKATLERRIATQTTTLLAIFDRLTKADNATPDEIYQQILGLLEEQFNVQLASVYLLDDSELKLKNFIGEKAERQLPETLELSSGMIGEVINTKGMVSINQAVTRHDLKKIIKHKILMAAPLLRKDKTVIGVVIIERMPFLEFNAQALRIFAKIVQWASTVIEKQLQMQEMQESSFKDEITGAHTYIYFMKRLDQEIARAKRFRSQLSLVLFRICDADLMRKDTKSDVLEVLNFIFSHTLDKTEIVARYQRTDTFAIIFPNQGIPRAKAVMSSIKEEIDNFNFRPFDHSPKPLMIKFGATSLSAAISTTAELVKKAEMCIEEFPREIDPEPTKVHFRMKDMFPAHNGNRPFTDVAFLQRKES